MTAIRPQKAVWTCKDGRKVLVCDMDDRHLLNTIALLERHYASNCVQLACSAWAYASDAPDGAAYAAEQAASQSIDEASKPTPECVAAEYPIYAALITERERREL